MTYYILANQFDGKLIQCGSTYVEPSEGQISLVREGVLPDLDMYYWSPTNLAFVQKNQDRFITHYKFINRFTLDELVVIYSLRKTVVEIEIMLDKFDKAQVIDLDDPQLVDGLNQLESQGILSAGRSAEIRT